MRLRRAQLVVLVIALGAGAMAVKLVKMSESTPASPPTPPPVAQLETTDVLVASKEIGIGQTLSAQDISWQAWPAANAGATEFITKAKRPAAIQELTGTRSRTSFVAGEPIRESGLVRAGNGFLSGILAKGMRGVAVEISPENGAGGFILPGDHVDVILTRAPPGGKVEEGSSSNTILLNVRVLAIDHIVDENRSQSTAVGKVATLELSPSQAQTLTLARRLGTLSLVLRAFGDSSVPEPDPTNLGAQVNIVRFGINANTLR